jgi:hypothetical protein
MEQPILRFNGVLELSKSVISSLEQTLFCHCRVLIYTRYQVFIIMATLGSLGHTSSALGSGNLMPSAEDLLPCCLLVVLILYFVDAFIRKNDRKNSEQE